MGVRIVKMQWDHPRMDAIKKAGQILKDGGLVAFPTETVYGLGGNALDVCASHKIYTAKGRPSDNPLIIHIADMESLNLIADEIPPAALKLACKYWPGPLTMIFKKSDQVPYQTTGGLDSVAVRIPSHPIAQELIRAGGGYVAAPSANRSGRPSPTRAAHVIDDLGDQVDLIIDGGSVEIGLESTIVDFTEAVPTILRPGFISEAMLREILGDVLMDPGLGTDNTPPKAPGMKYRHYAPSGQLTIVEGDPDAVADCIRKLSKVKMDQGYAVGIICTDETRTQYPDGVVLSIGRLENEETIGRHLYDVLRTFDDNQVAYIYSESFHTPQLGQAIMNRLLKAAGYQVIEV